jgi:arylsulfatase A-like enzyme
VTQRPNVLLIVLDTARADGFSPYAPERKTPSIGQLAAMGTSYPGAIAPSCWTVPSHASMFLGAPPRSVGLSRIPNGEGTLCAPVIEDQKDRYLPEVMRRSGFQTSGISANLWISSRIGFSLGFEEFKDVTGDRVRKMADAGLRSRLRWYLDAIRARTDDGAQVIEGMLRGWIADRSRAPFFWFVNLLECHSPYLPPKPYNDLGPTQRIAAAEDARRYQTLEAVLRAAATGQGPPASATDRMRHLYDRSIELMDDWLARVLAALDRSGVLEDTIVIVTSDHGENFGEGGLIGHAGSLDDRLLRVPLVMAGPNVAPAPEGVVSLADLPRIIASLVGLSDHPWGEVRHPGIAVAQFDGAMRPDNPNIGVLDEWGATTEGRARLTHRFTAATDGTLKLVRTHEGDRLFDLVADAAETGSVDASGYAADRVGALRQALDLASEEAWDPDIDAPPPSEDAEELAAIEERMKLLGYL